MVTEMLNLMKMMMESTLPSSDTTDAASNQGMEDTSVLHYVHLRGNLPTIADTTRTTSFLWTSLHVQINALYNVGNLKSLNSENPKKGSNNTIVDFKSGCLTCKLIYRSNEGTLGCVKKNFLILIVIN